MVTSFLACSAPLGPGVDAVSVTYTKHWTTVVRADLDLVYVVDERPGMADTTAQLDPFASALSQRCTRLGVVPNVRTQLISSSDGQLLSALASGVGGSLRPDADLAIVIVSDGDDASAGDVSGFVQGVQSLKTDPYQILVIGVLGPSSARLTDFVAGFPDSLLLSVADDQWGTEALTPFCAIADDSPNPPCVPSTVHDCVVTQHLTTAEGAQDLIVPQCPADPGGSFCWHLDTSGIYFCPDAQEAVMLANQPTGADSSDYASTLVISCQLSGTN